MPKYLNKSFDIKDLKRKIDLQIQIDSATEFLLKKVAKLEMDIQKLEQDNDKLKDKVRSYVKKEKGSRRAK